MLHLVMPVSLIIPPPDFVISASIQQSTARQEFTKAAFGVMLRASQGRLRSQVGLTTAERRIKCKG